MLTEQLRELEADGLVHREVYPEVPPKVEYSLTEKGKTVIPVIEKLRDWGIAYLEIGDHAAIRERAHYEIGLRMATGARPRDVLVQFLAEALVLGFLGGLFGVVYGVAGATIVGKITAWQTVISLEPIFISPLFSLAIGLFFGVYPARKASLLNPIDALRAE